MTVKITRITIEFVLFLQQTIMYDRHMTKWRMETYATTTMEIYISLLLLRLLRRGENTTYYYYAEVPSSLFHIIMIIKCSSN